MSHQLTPQEQLDEIYHLLKKQESREKQRTFFRIIKWISILAIIYFITKNPMFTQGILTSFVKSTIDAVQPMMIEQIQSTLSGQVNAGQVDAMKKLQQILQP